MTTIEPDRENTAPFFADRRAAGAALAQRLERYRGSHPLVLGLPRGGVPVAAEVARHLDGELDVVVARKLGSPVSPELAIGAVTADGVRFLNTKVIEMLDVPAAYIERVAADQQAEAQRREARFRGGRAPLRVAGRTVILVDDGLATGATMRAAVRAMRTQGPARLVVAVPVGAPDACAALRTEVDEVACLAEPPDFGAVGFYYADFGQVDDAVVEELLQPAAAAALGVS
jgi:putative phosphoribosyl transferase